MDKRKKEKEQFFRDMDRAIALLSFHFDAIKEVTQRDHLKGFQEALRDLKCEDCKSKMLGACSGGNYETIGVLMCMEHKDLCVDATELSMN